MAPKTNKKRPSIDTLESEVTKKIKSMTEDVDGEIKGAGSKWKSMQKDLRNLSVTVEKLAQERENFTRTAQIAIDREPELLKTIEEKETEIEGLKLELARMRETMKKNKDSLTVMGRDSNYWFGEYKRYLCESLKFRSETKVKDETVADLKAKLSTYEKMKEVIKEMTKAEQGSAEATSQ